MKKLQGPVVQSEIKANPGKNLTQCFIFLYFYTSVYFETLKMKTFIDPDEMPEEIFLNEETVGKICFEFKLNLD